MVRNLISLIPRANHFDADGTPRFVGAADARVDEDTWTADLRHNAGTRDRLLAFFGRQRITGVVRVHRPEGHDRLSDWTRQPGRFRYFETTSGTCLLNASHIVEVSEIPE